MSQAGSPGMDADLSARSEQLFQEDWRQLSRRTDRLFAWLMLAQWVFAIVLALWVSPWAWEGTVREVNVHVYAALLLGGVTALFPIVLVWLNPGAPINRHVIAVAQMLFSALLIHLTGGRIETHFHVFGSLAFLAFYRDWKVLVPATLVVATDHFARGLFWPESVYGVAVPEWWRFLEHAAWVVFEDIVLVMACVTWTREMRSNAERQARLEEVSRQEREKSARLDTALTALQESHETVIRVEKLAAIGQLAASVAHELRNPLSAVANSNAYMLEKLDEPGVEEKLGDARVRQFLGIAGRELGNCNRIIGELLDFARERPPELEPCALHELVAEAISLVPKRDRVTVENAIPAGFPEVPLDRDQFRKVFLNLVQNAVESIAADAPGKVSVRAQGGGSAPLEIVVEDDGAGIPVGLRETIFQPLYTSKTRGTGLGLAIVAGSVRRHGGTIRVESEPGKGSRFVIVLPAAAAQDASAAA